MAVTLCSECKRKPFETGPLADGMCQYCAAEKRCYVCNCDATKDGDWGKLCDSEECAKADAFRTFRHYS